MQKSPCHPSVSLKLRRMGKRGEFLTSCPDPECGEKYQVTQDGHIYQTAKKHTDSKTERGSWRLTGKRLREIESKWGSVQAYLDGGKV